MPTVLTVFEYPTLNGGERSWLASVPHLQALGFELCAAAPAEGALAEALAAQGVRHDSFSFVDDRKRRRTQAALRAELAERLTRLRPALVHANSLSMARLAAPVAAEAGIPVLGHLRDMLRLSRQAVRDLNRCTRLLAVSQAVCSYYVAAGLAPEKIWVSWNGVDLCEFAAATARGCLASELAIAPESFLVGTVGQLGIRKAQDVLLEAASRVLVKFPQTHVVMVGERNSGKEEAVDYELRLRWRAACPDLAGHVHFLGRRTDIPALLREFTLLAHPARQEPLGRVLLEAAATSVPIVATDVGGTREIFPALVRAATIVPPGNPVALAAAIERLLAHRDERVAMGQRARQRAVRKLNIRDSAARWAQHYGDAIQHATI